MTAAAPDTDAWSSARICGSARTTTDESASARPAASDRRRLDRAGQSSGGDHKSTVPALRRGPPGAIPRLAGRQMHAAVVHDSQRAPLSRWARTPSARGRRRPWLARHEDWNSGPHVPVVCEILRPYCCPQARGVPADGDATSCHGRGRGRAEAANTGHPVGQESRCPAGGAAARAAACRRPMRPHETEDEMRQRTSPSGWPEPAHAANGWWSERGCSPSWLRRRRSPGCWARR